MFNDDDGYVSYRGKTSSVVNYRHEERRWLMRMVNNPKVWAVSNASMASLIMGEWAAATEVLGLQPAHSPMGITGR